MPSKKTAKTEKTEKPAKKAAKTVKDEKVASEPKTAGSRQTLVW